jgi:hypothetical protein
MVIVAITEHNPEKIVESRVKITRKIKNVMAGFTRKNTGAVEGK